MNKLILDCSEASELCNERQYMSLSRIKRVQLWVHLAMCRSCRQYARDIEWMEDSISSYRDKTLDDVLYNLPSHKKNIMREAILEEQQNM